jgi:hypothetical protein
MAAGLNGYFKDLDEPADQAKNHQGNEPIRLQHVCSEACPDNAEYEQYVDHDPEPSPL